MNFRFSIVPLFLLIARLHAFYPVQEQKLETIYDYFAHLTVKECDIGEHMPLLRQLAAECPIVTEIGLGWVISTWGLLKGLSENPAEIRQYTGIDLFHPYAENLNLAKAEAEKKGIRFQFHQANDLDVQIEPTDFLFIDSMHTYRHLRYELETFSPQVRKYIAMHDTSEPWGDRDDSEYAELMDESKYPAHYDRRKKGLWLAVADFLETHPEWVLQERRLNCHGFTVLKRVSPN